MKPFVFFLIALIFSFFIAGCEKTNYKESIPQLEAIVQEDPTEENRQKLANLYLEFANQSEKNDSLRLPRILQAADILFKLENFDEAGKVLRQGIQDYFPDRAVDPAIIALANLHFERDTATEIRKEKLKQFRSCFPNEELAKERLNQLIDAAAGQSTDSITLQMNARASFNFMNLSELYGRWFFNDDKGGERLMEAAKMAVFFNKFERAILIYEELAQTFEGKDLGAKAAFMLAFTLDNHLNRLDEARAQYNRFINRYQEHPLAESARFLLQNLGKSEEEIISGFKRN